MSLNVKVQIAALLFVAVVLTGCSGINASHSVSPATFLLPGLMKAEPAPDKTTDLPAIQTRHQDTTLS